MWRAMFLLLTLSFVVPMAAEAQIGWFKERINKNREYPLGAKPTVDHYPGSYHALREDLGFFQVVGFEEGASLTLRFLPGDEDIAFERDPDVKASIDCDPAKPVLLRPGEVCAIMTYVEERERKYHLQASWVHDEHEGAWEVKVHVKMQMLKLPK